MPTANTFFLVIKANGKLLSLKEVFAIDETGNLLPPLSSRMSSFFPGWSSFRCLDKNNETHCATRLGDRDPWLEVEYSLKNGIGQVGLVNYGTKADKATIAIYDDVERQGLLWEGRFEGDKDAQTWDGVFRLPCYRMCINVFPFVR